MTKVVLLTLHYRDEDNDVIVCGSMEIARRMAVKVVTQNRDSWVKPGEIGDLIQLVAEINTTTSNVVDSRRCSSEWISWEEMEIIT